MASSVITHLYTIVKKDTKHKNISALPLGQPWSLHEIITLTRIYYWNKYVFAKHLFLLVK